jgi:uncharacterized protein (DUF342 family)
MAQSENVEIFKGPLKGENLEIPEKKLIIEGNLVACQISANADIEIIGNVMDCIIHNHGGGLRVSGGVVNSKMDIFGDIYCRYLEKSDLISRFGALYAEKHIYSSSVSVMSMVHLLDEKSEVVASALSSSIEISSARVGRPEGSTPSRLELRPRKKQDLFELFFIYKQKLGEKEEELASLERYIKVFSLIKDKIKDLPPAKKNELVSKIQQYQNLKKTIQLIELEKERMFLKNPEEDKYNRTVLVRGAVFPPVEVVIDGQGLDIREPERRVGFYKSGIVIRGELEKIHNRRKVVALL